MNRESMINREVFIPETNSDSDQINPEVTKSQEKIEVGLEEREEVVDAWQKIVLGREMAVPDLEFLSDQEFTRWLNQSLMDEVENIADQWIAEEVNQEASMPEEQQKVAKAKKTVDDFREEIAEISDQAERLQKEIDFLNQVGILIRAMKSRQPKSNKWNSWPTTMRENRGANCHATSMLAETLLSRGFDERYFGNPVGHSINLVRMCDGSWTYLDFTNNRLRRIEPKITELEELPRTGPIPYLEIDDPVIDYRLIAVCDVDTYPTQGVLDNIGALMSEAKRDSTDEEHRQAVDFYHKFPDLLDRDIISGHKLSSRLFPGANDLYGSRLWEEEEKRVDSLRMEKYIQHSLNFAMKHIGEINDTLSQINIAAQMSAWENYFLGGSDQPPVVTGNEIFDRFINMTRDGLDRNLPNETEMRESIVRKLVNQLANIPTQ